MCLLKPADRLNVCNHGECFQNNILNKQKMCMFNTTATSMVQPNHKEANNVHQQNFLQTQAIAPHQLLQSGQATPNIFQSLLLSSSSASNVSDDESLVLNKRQFKADNHADKYINTNMELEAANTAVQPAAGQVIYLVPNFNTTYGNQNNTVNTSNFTFNDLCKDQFSHNSFMQNIYDNNNQFASNTINYPQDINNTFYINNIHENIQQSPPSKPDSAKSFDLEESLRAMESDIFDVLMTRNKMVMELRDKNETVQDTLANLINEICDLKRIIKGSSEKSEKPNAPNYPHQGYVPENKLSASDSFIRQLYGADTTFPYQLILRQDLQLPLTRERNFKLDLLLTDNEGNQIKNSNRIPVKIAIYTSESQPQLTEFNTQGNKLLKGVVSTEIVDGRAVFDKVQIREVTSRFRNGWVYLVVYPVVKESNLNGLFPSSDNIYVESKQIKPLVIEKLVVKAKRVKDAEQNSDE